MLLTLQEVFDFSQFNLDQEFWKSPETTALFALKEKKKAVAQTEVTFGVWACIRK